MRTHLATGRRARSGRLLVGLVLLDAASCRHEPTAPRLAPPIWQTPLASIMGSRDGWPGMPATDGVRAYVDVGRGIAALDVATGVIQWTTEPWAGRTSPDAWRLVLSDGRLYAVSLGATVALDPATGALLWSARPDSLSTTARPSSDARLVYVGTTDRRLVALRATDGALSWSVALDPEATFGGTIAGSVARGDTVFVTGTRFEDANGWQRRAWFAAVDARTGVRLWRTFDTDSFSTSFSPPVLVGAHVLSSDPLGGSLIAWNATTGERSWRVATAQGFVGPFGPPVVLGDTAFVGAGDGRLYAVDVERGIVRFNVDVGPSIRYTAVCGRYLLAQGQGVYFVDRRRHVLLGRRFDDDVGANGFATSAFAVSGDTAVVVGTGSAAAFHC